MNLVSREVAMAATAAYIKKNADEADARIAEGYGSEVGEYRRRLAKLQKNIEIVEDAFSGYREDQENPEEVEAMSIGGEDDE